MSGEIAGRPESLLLAAARLDRAFAAGGVSELAAPYAEDARLMWPGMDDIVGREAIAAAFEEFFSQFNTLSFSPDRATVEVFGDRAFTVGKFTEDLEPRTGGPAQRVHGRLVEAWSRTAEGDWLIDLMLTGRYAENETLTE